MFSLAEIAKDFITELLFGPEIPDFSISGSQMRVPYARHCRHLAHLAPKIRVNLY